MKDEKKKRNFMKKSKYNFKRGEKFETVFHLSISSKAIFKLSDSALKLYILFVLNGKKNPPSIKLFANRMKKSERTISRIYDELKEKNFLKIQCISPKKYKYVFDMNGNVNYDYKEEKEKHEQKLIEKEVDVKEIENEEHFEEDFNQEVFEKAKTIKEYEDFAILENIFWNLKPKERKEIVSIIEKRKVLETDSKEVIDWFLEKVKYV
jgi:DNA-binding transcriptional regulator YhcF (GntR family)